VNLTDSRLSPYGRDWAAASEAAWDLKAALTLLRWQELHASQVRGGSFEFFWPLLETNP